MINLDPKLSKILDNAENVNVSDNKVPADPKVSILVQTYNHHLTIAQCLEGILSQKTDFAYEILLGEDDSRDGTREVCLAYAKKYPERIRLFLHQRSNNIAINGKPTGKFNVLYNFKEVRGEYFAICEGDDFWIDDCKLQKQVDALEANPGASLCYTRVNLMDRNGNMQSDDESITESRFRQIRDSSELNIIHLLTVGNFIHTCSILAKTEGLSIPPEFEKSPVGDYLLYILLTQENQRIIKLEGEATAVYRNETGTWSSSSYRAMLINMALYQSCILSLLKNPEHRQLFLDNVHDHTMNISNYMENIVAREPSFKECITFLVKKVMRRVGTKK